MTAPRKFTKMHGCGNSFLVAPGNREAARELAPFIPALCTPSFGLGADGIMLIEARPKGDFEVFMYNPDGSPMGMCGNGIRCVARFVHEAGLVPNTGESVRFTVEGREILCRILEGGRTIEVNMGSPRFLPAEIPVTRESPCVDASLQTPAGEFVFTTVSMGNPHCVIFVEDVEKIDLTVIGPIIEHHPEFPRRTNVEFVTALARDRLSVRVWERGAGITLACGTGACASLVAGVLTGRCDTAAEVTLPGGSVKIFWDRAADVVMMTGPASRVGEITLTDEFYQSAENRS